MEESKHISLNQIHPSETQPRKNFDENGLKELAQSIKKNGVLQSILVRPSPSKKGQYEIICGERRYRSSLMVGLADIPARVVEATDEQVLRYQIIENLQRRSVNAMEDARALHRLYSDFSMTQKEIGSTVGKAESYVNAQLSLISGVPELQEALEKNWLTRAAALRLVKLSDPEKQKNATLELQRKNGKLVTIQKVEEYINRHYGAAVRHVGFKSTPKTNDFNKNWKYYLVRFSADQFRQWQSIVRNRIDTETLAEAVEIVMLEASPAGKNDNGNIETAKAA